MKTENENPSNKIIPEKEYKKNIHQEKGAVELLELQKKMQQMIYDFKAKHEEYMTCRLQVGEYGTLLLLPVDIIKLGR